MPTTHLCQRVLAWSGLTLGWIGAVAIMDWGTCWYFFKAIVSLIHSPPRHNDIALKSFSALPHPSLYLQFPTPPQHPLSHTTPSTEPLHPEVTPHLHEGELTPNHSYHPAWDPTAPEPMYDPTTQACHKLELSWARRPRVRNMNTSGTGSETHYHSVE